MNIFNLFRGEHLMSATEGIVDKTNRIINIASANHIQVQTAYSYILEALSMGHAYNFQHFSISFVDFVCIIQAYTLCYTCPRTNHSNIDENIKSLCIVDVNHSNKRQRIAENESCAFVAVDKGTESDKNNINTRKPPSLPLIHALYLHLKGLRHTHTDTIAITTNQINDISLPDNCTHESDGQLKNDDASLTDGNRNRYELEIGRIRAVDAHMKRLFSSSAINNEQSIRNAHWISKLFPYWCGLVGGGGSSDRYDTDDRTVIDRDESIFHCPYNVECVDSSNAQLSSIVQSDERYVKQEGSRLINDLNPKSLNHRIETVVDKDNILDYLC